MISAAGRKGDAAFPRIRTCEADEPSSLHTPGFGWISLDRKIAAGATRVCQGEVGREITQVSTAMYNDNKIVRGRVLLALVVRYYASGKSGQVLYDLHHLQSLKMKGGNIEGLHNAWNMALSELAT